MKQLPLKMTPNLKFKVFSLYYKGFYSKISSNELACTERILKRKGKVKNKCPETNLDLSHPLSSTNVSGQASVLKKTNTNANRRRAKTNIFTKNWVEKYLKKSLSWVTSERKKWGEMGWNNAFGPTITTCISEAPLSLSNVHIHSIPSHTHEKLVECPVEDFGNCHMHMHVLQYSHGHAWKVTDSSKLRVRHSLIMNWMTFNCVGRFAANSSRSRFAARSFHP